MKTWARVLDTDFQNFPDFPIPGGNPAWDSGIEAGLNYPLPLAHHSRKPFYLPKSRAVRLEHFQNSSKKRLSALKATSSYFHLSFLMREFISNRANPSFTRSLYFILFTYSQTIHLLRIFSLFLFRNRKLRVKNCSQGRKRVYEKKRIITLSFIVMLHIFYALNCKAIYFL